MTYPTQTPTLCYATVADLLAQCPELAPWPEAQLTDLLLTAQGYVDHYVGFATPASCDPCQQSTLFPRACDTVCVTDPDTGQTTQQLGIPHAVQQATLAAAYLLSLERKPTPAPDDPTDDDSDSTGDTDDTDISTTSGSDQSLLDCLAPGDRVTLGDFTYSRGCCGDPTTTSTRTSVSRTVVDPCCSVAFSTGGAYLRQWLGGSAAGRTFMTLLEDYRCLTWGIC